MAKRHTIVAFSGHMTDAPDRPSPRFPEHAVPSVRARVRNALAARGAGLIGVSSAARGGDLIFIEELLALGGSAIVLLPFPAQDFKTTSVGRGWDDTFDRLLKSAQVNVPPPIHAQLPADSSERDAAYEACNVAIIATAQQLATEHGDTDPLFLAVYMQTDADRQGGTGQAFRGWTDLGHRLELIDPRG
jgi:hypothetical protein